MTEVEGVVRGGVIIPFSSLREFEGRRVRIRIIEVSDVEPPEKLYSYVRLLREGEDAEELFKI